MLHMQTESVLCQEGKSDGGVVLSVGEEPSDKHERLAQKIAYPADRPLAAKFSILRTKSLVEQQEKASWIYYLLLPAIMIVSVTFALRIWLYRIIFRPKDPLRKMIGPKKMSYLFDKAHPLGEQLREGVTTSAALDGYYNAQLIIPRIRTLGERIIAFSLYSPDPCAVRNRLRITYLEILQELRRIYASGQKSIDYLSLACGSAQATIEAVSVFLEEFPDARVNLLLVDLNDDSLKQASYFARKRGIGGCMRVRKGDLKRYLKGEKSKKWDVVEMVGFLDYRPAKSVAGYCADIRRVLKVGGLFVGAHIAPSPWSFMVRWWLNWPLLKRRSPETYRQLLIGGGFSPEEIRLVVEPNKIHTVSLCRKIT